MAAKFTDGMKHPGTKTVSSHDPKEAGSRNEAGLSRRNTMTGMPGHVPSGQSKSRGGAEGGKAGMTVNGPKDLKPGSGRGNGKRMESPGKRATGTMAGKMESLKGRAKTSSERPRKGSTMYSLTLLALPVMLFVAFSLFAPSHAVAAAVVGSAPAFGAIAAAKVPLLAMTIQAWIPGEPSQQKTAQQGFLTKQAVSTTVSLVGATLAPTDFVVITTMGAAGAIKLLGGNDTGNGPCLPGDTMIIANHSGQNVTIYPNNSLGTVKNGAAGAGTLIATGLTAQLVYFGSDNWAMSAS